MDDKEESKLEDEERVRREFFLGENTEHIEKLYREQLSGSQDQLNEAYKSYRKKNYPYGKYWTMEDLEYAFIKGKIFVLSFPVTLTVLSIFFFILAVTWLISFVIIISTWINSGTFQMMDLGLYLFLFFVLEIPLVTIIIGLSFERRRVLVIGPSGVYYRKVIKTGYFRWSDVIAWKGSTITQTGPKRSLITFAKVMVRVSGETIYFKSSSYSLKEFAKKLKLQMFLKLFQTYSELAILVRNSKTIGTSDWKDRLNN